MIPQFRGLGHGPPVCAHSPSRLFRWWRPGHSDPEWRVGWVTISPWEQGVAWRQAAGQTYIKLPAFSTAAPAPPPGGAQRAPQAWGVPQSPSVTLPSTWDRTGTCSRVCRGTISSHSPCTSLSEAVLQEAQREPRNASTLGVSPSPSLHTPPPPCSLPSCDSRALLHSHTLVCLHEFFSLLFFFSSFLLNPTTHLHPNTTTPSPAYTQQLSACSLIVLFRNPKLNYIFFLNKDLCCLFIIIHLPFLTFFKD